MKDQLVRLRRLCPAWKHQTAAAALLPYALLTVSLAGNVYFALDKSSDARSRDLVTVKVGTHLPPIEAVSLDGVPKTVKCPKGKKGTVVYVFSPRCLWCQRNVANISTLASSVAQDYSVVGVPLLSDGLSELLREQPLRFTVLMAPSLAARNAYQMRSTPTTYLVSSDGVLIDIWMGAYSGGTKNAIERRFNVRLPGLAQ